jgi:hypothetical protein
MSFDRRKWLRSDLALPVIVISGGKDYTARITNIAPMGAMLELSAPLTEGTTLLLRCGSIEAEAVVVWMKNLRIGVMFSAPLNGRQIDVQLSRAAALASRKSGITRLVAANNNSGGSNPTGRSSTLL